MRVAHSLPLLVLLAGCADEEAVTVVHLQARRAVGAVTQVEVALDNDNATQRQSFPVTGKQFPLSFSVYTAGRTGTMTIHAEAKSGGGDVRASGDLAVELDPAGRVDADLMLEPNDFVVNTTFVGTQDLAFRIDAGGRQLSAGPDGHFTIGWSDTCQMVGRCDVFGRRFDDTGTPLTTAIAAGTTQFNFNQTSGLIGYEPSLATDRSGNTVAAWSTGTELYATVVDAGGSALTTTETILTSGTAPGTPAAIALPDGRFVVAWSDQSVTPGQSVIKAIYLSSAGLPINNPVTMTPAPFQVSTTIMSADDAPAMVAFGNGAAFAVAWHDGPIVRGRFYGTTGAPGGGTDIVLATYPVGDEIDPPQLGTIGGDALLLFRRATDGGDADSGQLVLRRMSSQGIHVGSDVLVTDDVEFGPAGVATLDGNVAVVWAACVAHSDGAGCGIWLRQYGADLAPRTDAIAVNTTTVGDQEDPSVAWLPDGAVAVAWSDGSQADPDRDGGAVRARILYPTAR